MLISEFGIPTGKAASIDLALFLYRCDNKGGAKLRHATFRTGLQSCMLLRSMAYPYDKN